ncbi:sugar-binding protein [Gracilibacillus saliphilus]|uniref:sugar-binding protein n=1 Tax=Gracilibacillus saliphilus TaxID=543890 RepID=UPI0013D8056C|nr:sugar-binding protein [Gracilibacillus saliphilus]
MQKLIFILLFSISFLLMIYFGKETFYIEGELGTENPYDYHFVLIIEEIGNDYWRLVEKGAREEAAEHNIYLEYTGPKVLDEEEQLAIFDRMIAADVDGIIIKGINNERFDTLVQKAVNHNITVATIDADNENSGRHFYIGTDNYKAGYLAGQTMVNQTTGEQKVAVIIGTRNAQNQIERLSGFQDAIDLSERIELIRIAESNITTLGAAQATYRVLKEHPDITAFFGASALDGIGIVQGIKEMKTKEHPYIISFDILPETLDEIEKGYIEATVVQYPEEMGRRSVELMLQLQQNQTLEPFYYTETGVVDSSHIYNGELIAPIEVGELP